MRSDSSVPIDVLPSLVGLLERRAATQPDERAYLFLSDHGAEEASITYGELWGSASALAARFVDVTKPGDRALLVFPAGLEFIVGFFACLIARVIAVPMMVPRRQSSRDASASIVANCKPTIALASPALMVRSDLRDRIAGLEWLSVDLAPGIAPSTVPARPGRDDIAFLQYTSGSTSDPKGVVVSHGNLLANLEMNRVSLSNTSASIGVNWIPHYHDMGLVFGILTPLYLGALGVLMSPNAFMQRPLLWLRAISRYRAELGASPNFGFDLCVSRFRAEQMQDIDLSCWKVVNSGAEPIRHETVLRFNETFAPYGLDPRAAYPSYGMAEATLQVTGSRRGAGHVARAISRAALLENAIRPPTDEADSQTVVGCGRAILDEQIAIVEAQTRRRLGTDEVGEIWVSGPHVASGYWQNDEATQASLRARIAGEDDGANWLRSGDLGFLDETGQLFVTGRIKELIIIRGMNHYPQDIERTVQAAHPALRLNCGAAFSVVDERGEEHLVVVQEVERTARNKIDPQEIAGIIREAVTKDHEIFVRHIELIRPQTLPKTTSGKVQRALTRKLWLEGKLDYLRAESAA